MQIAVILCCLRITMRKQRMYMLSRCIFSSIFHMQLVDFLDVESADAEGLMYDYGIVST